MVTLRGHCGAWPCVSRRLWVYTETAVRGTCQTKYWMRGGLFLSLRVSPT